MVEVVVGVMIVGESCGGWQWSKFLEL
jgi:hypothetical protein